VRNLLCFFLFFTAKSRFFVASLLRMTGLVDFRRSAAKHLFFLVENKQKQILRADYSKVFKWRSALRFPQDDTAGGFFRSLLVHCVASVTHKTAERLCHHQAAAEKRTVSTRSFKGEFCPGFHGGMVEASSAQNSFLGGTKLPISLKTNGRGETNGGTKLPFRVVSSMAN
jgi:hypothetical protein